MPPASVRPMTARSWVVMSAKKMRSMIAAPIPAKITFRRCSFGTPAAAMSDDDGIVAGQDEIDGDDLPKGHKLRPEPQVFHRSDLPVVKAAGRSNTDCEAL